MISRVYCFNYSSLGGGEKLDVPTIDGTFFIYEQNYFMLSSVDVIYITLRPMLNEQIGMHVYE